MSQLEIGLTAALSLVVFIVIVVAVIALIRYLKERAHVENQQLVFAQMMPMVPPGQAPNGQGVPPAAV